jgi:hypothetical protein
MEQANLEGLGSASCYWEFESLVLARLEEILKVTEARNHCSRNTEASREPRAPSKVTGPRVGGSGLDQGPSLPLRVFPQVSWKPCLEPVDPQGGPEAGMGAASWAHRLLLADLFVPPPSTHADGCRGTGWEEASVTPKGPLGC